MNTKAKAVCKLLNEKYIPITQKFLSCVTVFWFLFFVVTQLALPSERDVLDTQCRVYEGEWWHITREGEYVPVQVPGKVAAENGEPVSFSTILPEHIDAGECMCFYAVWQDVEIYIDGELRAVYNTENTRLFGINSPTRYVFVELEETDAGAELIYQITSTSKYAGAMRSCYIGDRMGIWVHLFGKAGLQSVIAIFLAFLSLFCIIICAVLKFAYRRPLPLSYLAWSIFFCACWMMTEIEFRQIMIKNVSALSLYAYWSLMIIPIPLCVYMNEIQHYRYHKLYMGPICYAAVILIIGTCLQVFDVVQFVSQVPYIHMGIIGALLCIMGTIVADTVKHRLSEYMIVGIGILGLLFTTVLEMLAYYMGIGMSLGTVLSMGLVFLLVMAIIKTGQDLFETEKKRQEAIMARNAQAKFLANMSHEIRTPINAIIGMNEMILRENADGAVQEYAVSIRNASKMLLGLVNDVLDFSKIESGQLELLEDTYDLGELLQDEMSLLRARAAEKPIITRLEAEPDIPSELWGDELRIKQILTNLLSNAVKYTKEGTVTLRVSYRRTDVDRLTLYFSVIDTGIGIKEENLSQVFDSFKRLELEKNRNVQGTGLGLNIAKQLVTLMQGSISVESEYGKGSRFSIAIPQKIMGHKPIGELKGMQMRAGKKKEKSQTLFTAPGAKVLAVDDSTMNLAVIKGLLKRTEMELDCAESGKEALELTRSKKYDIILMDHMMPELDGVETLHLLRADKKNENRNATVIALTANAVAGCKEMYAGYGFDDYFTKPILADKLEELLLLHLPGELVHRTGEKEEENSQEREKEREEMQDNNSVNDYKAEGENVPEELLVIDHELGLSYCMDSEELYEEILGEFEKQVKEYLPKLDACFEAQDLGQYAILTHALKGSTLNIGASAFSKLSLSHELAAKEENGGFVKEKYASYRAALVKLLEKVQA